MATVITAYPAQLAARTSQRSPTAKAISGNVQNLNGGAILMGGDLYDSPLTKNLTLGDNLGDTPIKGSTPIESSELGTSKSDTSGTFLNDVDDMIMLVDAAVLTPASDQKNRGIRFNGVDNMQKKSDTTINFPSGQLASIVTVGSELVLNGALTTSTDWNSSGAGSIAFGASGATLTGPKVLFTAVPLIAVDETWYKMTFTIESLSGTGVTTDVVNGKMINTKNIYIVSPTTISANGVGITYYFLATTAAPEIAFTAASGTSFIVSDVSIKKTIDRPIFYTANDGSDTIDSNSPPVPLIDDAAHPTKDIPGELQFYDGAKLPKQADYSSKYSI